ncbi:MAG: MBL fold metallo-hydrolase [Eubacteriales bacterium]|nr:MBL fold metallo-hydrolase [Eubacteriales bacterium]
MLFCTLSSGSSGNSVLLSHDDTNILIDCGRSGKHICSRLQELNIPPESINAILVTHEHSDHTCGLGVFSRKFDVPIYTTNGTWEGINNSSTIGKISERNINTISPYQTFDIGNIKIVPFQIPHDANQPVGYRFLAGNTVVACATDIGYLSESVVRGVAGANVVLLESNHDVDMLMRSTKYSQQLKNRILSNEGHLCNNHAAAFASYLAKNGTEHILLGHLSEENNDPEIAYNTTANALAAKGIDYKRDVFITVARRHELSEVIRI